MSMMKNLPEIGWRQRRQVLLRAMLYGGDSLAVVACGGAALRTLLAATSQRWAGSVGTTAESSVRMILRQQPMKNKKKKRRRNKQKKRADKSARPVKPGPHEVDLVNPGPLPRRAGPFIEPVGRAEAALNDAPRPEPKRASFDPCEYRVYFTTDRRPHVPGDYLQGFGRRFDDRLHFGSCVIHIPRSHAYASTGSGILDRGLRLALGQSRDEPLKLVAIEQRTSHSFVDALAAHMTRLDSVSREILLFLHGYNVSFKDAAIRAAQLGRDLEISGPVVFFSWPSFAMAPFYAPDEANIDRTRRKFLEFIRLLGSVDGLRAINVIAHSMGNRILEQSASVLVASTDGPSAPLGQIILAAPDVDRGVIIQAAADYAKLRLPERRTTLYCNPSDRAVALSGLLHQNPRGGRYGVGVPNTDCILWSPTGFGFNLGHNFAGNEGVMRDMQQLLATHAPPSERKHLTPVPHDCPQFWKLQR